MIRWVLGFIGVYALFHEAMPVLLGMFLEGGHELLVMAGLVP